MTKGALARLWDVARASPAEVGLVALLGVAVVAGSAAVYARTGGPPAPPLEAVEAQAPAASPAPVLLVHVAGQVASPGVYELAAGSRVRDALAAAGGPVEGADLSALNLAAPVTDGQKVVVTRPGEPPPPEAAGPPGKVNLNTATAAELETLPGVGPVLAERILARRQSRGRFTSVRQLMEVEGFGPKKYEALKDLVTV